MLNKVQIIGRAGKDPEVRYGPSGDAIANLSIATTESWKDKASGERQEKTEWHRVVVFGKLAEIVGEYVKKGALVYFEGKLETRKWQDKDTGQDRYATEIKVDSFGGTMKMLGGRGDNDNGGQRQDGGGYGDTQRQPQRQAAAGGQQRQADPAQQQRSQQLADMDDDIPF